ncbi:MAG: hypothetical protein H6508_00900 [Calditrichaeota bacterium]|nr:hypothetical protein [Calditrichota bacterium]MCB9365733.1 hypothetical protein [Calditrichota bacterium]
MRIFVLLSMLGIVTQSQAFDMTSWVPAESDQVIFCWEAVPGVEHYELHVSASFGGPYSLAEIVNTLETSRPNLHRGYSREFVFAAAINASGEVIGVSDTIGCYFLSNTADVPQGSIKIAQFGVGGLQYFSLAGDSGCAHTDVLSTSPSDIIGVQTTALGFALSSRVNRVDNWQIAYRNTNGDWTGSLEQTQNMVPGRAYVFVTADPDERPPILTGKATSEDSPQGVITVLAPSFPSAFAVTSMSLPIVDVRDVASLGLISSGFQSGTFTSSDLVVEVTTGKKTWLTSGMQWRGSLETCSPEQSYLIVNRTTGHTWAYDFSLIGQP